MREGDGDRTGGRPRLCVVTTTPLIVQFFLRPHLAALGERFDVTLVADRDCSELLGGRAAAVRMVVVPIAREIAPIRDIVGFATLFRLFLREKFDAVVTVAPKAGLLGIAAAALARVPVRCHVFQGEVWATRRGPIRLLLKAADRLVARLSTGVLVVSPSERDVLIREKIVTAAGSRVLGAGSLGGVDVARFAADPVRSARRRAEAGVPSGALLVLFVGRLKVDKGVLDLAAAVARLAPARPDLHLAVVGPDEDGLADRIRDTAGPALGARLHLHGLTEAPETWFAAADIVVLPSFREGLGMTLLEAGAAGLPVVASRIYGITDAVVDGETALLHPPGDVAALAGCLDRLAGDPVLRARLGAAGRDFVAERFEQSAVVGRFVDHLAAAAVARAGRRG